MGFFSALKKLWDAAPEAADKSATASSLTVESGQEEEAAAHKIPKTEALAGTEAAAASSLSSAEEAPCAAAVGEDVAASSVIPEATADSESEQETASEAQAAVESAVDNTAENAEEAVVEAPRKQGLFARLFGLGGTKKPAPAANLASEDSALEVPAPSVATEAFQAALTLRLREAEPRLSVWLGIILEGIQEAGDPLWERLRFLLQSLEAPEAEITAFLDDFRGWLERMEYRRVEEFRSELQYRLALALDLEDEEDERSRLFLKLSEGLSRTREQLSRQLDTLFSSHGALDEDFWEALEELFIMADMGYEPATRLVERLRERARVAGVKEPDGVRDLLRAELEEAFRLPRRISAVNPPEVILMIGVNGAGKTTTTAKLAHRARMQGKKVLIAAADTFRAGAIEQLRVWAERVGADFHAKAPGADPAAVAYEAMDRALAGGYDVLFVDTAGRLQTKVNLMEELAKIRSVLGKKHPGAPHRSILVLDATTGQNALSQAKLFREKAGVDELILTKLDGTAKGGVAIAVAMQFEVPISFIGLGEKLEDLRPFDGGSFATALLGDQIPAAAPRQGEK